VLSGRRYGAVEVCLKPESCIAPEQVKSAVEAYVPAPAPAPSRATCVTGACTDGAGGGGEHATERESSALPCCRSSCGRLLRNRSILHRDGPLPVSWQEDPVLAPNVSGIAISGTGTTHSLFAFCGVPFSAAFGFGGQRGTVRDAADDFWGCGPPTMP